ncbi:MAG TPA: translation elongation factor Ts [Bacteroidales bacterium]|jgi:elongation factor Ts|nr:translation elongation factor Ts [Bacteroidales bacterium]HOU97501.1 translation elongation factor Ts [Bacteroidales bacterium]
MTQITTADITKLRKVTGAGLMDCKNALTEAEGNIDKAIEIIRKRGQAIAMKRSDRETTEGCVVARSSSDKRFVVMTALSCETDFVAKNEGFIKVAEAIADAALKHRPKNIDELKQISVDGVTINDMIMEKVAAIGERMDIACYEFIEAEYVYSYIHFGSKIGSIVGFNKVIADEHVGKEIVMQITAQNPVAIDKDDVPQEIIEKELEIGKDQARKEGKPEDMVEKIALGKLNKFYKENTLLNQEYIGDSKMTVRQYLESVDKELKIVSFKRFSLVV